MAQSVSQTPTLGAAAPRALLVGNPNVGKSVIFGALTRRYVVVSNYPGTTVEVSRGTALFSGDPVELVDLPGVNNLIPQSEDERVTRDAIVFDRTEVVLQVVDAKNLRRGLLLTLTLAEMGVPFAVILNMMDEALERGVRIDRRELEKLLGVRVMSTVATRGKGIHKVRTWMAGGAANNSAGETGPVRSAVPVDYGPAIEAAVAEIEPLLPETAVSRRSVALMVLGADEGIRKWTRMVQSPDTASEIEAIRRRLSSGLRRPVSYEITQARLSAATKILEKVYRVDPALSGAMERMARFGETVTGRGAAHVTAFLGAALLLLSQGGFAPSVEGAAIAAAVVAAAVALGRSPRLSFLVLLATLAGLCLLGMLVHPLSQLLPEEGWIRSGWIQGAAGLLIVAGVLLGRQTTNLVWGTLGALSVLELIYLFVGVFGAGDLVDLLESRLFEGAISPAIVSVVDFILPPGGEGVLGSIAAFLNAALVGEYGALTMALSYSIAIILPVVGTFFLAFGILEDSGYLPRLAVMMNRGFRAMGLNGKAVLPMVLGLGCDTMATLTTRVLETKKERVIVTLLLALGIPCSAQLGVILGITGKIGTAAILWWLGTVAFVLFAVGWLSSLLLPGRQSDFILELPPLRVPRLGNIVMKTVARIEWYLKEAVPLFFLGTLVLFLLDVTGALERVKWAAKPIVTGWLGLPGETTPALLIGFLRRDYGAAGLSDVYNQGLMDPRQAVVALITITLFVPCIANFFIMIKERGWKTGVAMFLFIFPFAFLVGGLVNLLMGVLGVLS
ncbi:MAG: FeoB small GTPase domain-containing protein [Planctomycetota bacterium]|jgi:ferrous iron transport protein B